MIELYNCDISILNDTKKIEQIMLNAAKAANATIVDSKFHKFSPHGVSGTVIIAESHLAIHTWPEYAFAAVDIFTCGDLTDNPAAFNVLKTEFKAQSTSIIEVKRGILDVAPELLKHKPTA
jgi:S-adenosylmethionine decarboxylase